MRIYPLERGREIERSRRETFPFIGNAFEMERITPPFLLFRVPNARLCATGSSSAAPASPGRLTHQLYRRALAQAHI